MGRLNGGSGGVCLQKPWVAGSRQEVVTVPLPPWGGQVVMLTHLAPQGEGLVPRVGARGRQQPVSGQDGRSPQHERCEEVDVDVIPGAVQPPGG